MKCDVHRVRHLHTMILFCSNKILRVLDTPDIPQGDIVIIDDDEQFDDAVIGLESVLRELKRLK